MRASWSSRKSSPNIPNIGSDLLRWCAFSRGSDPCATLAQSAMGGRATKAKLSETRAVGIQGEIPCPDRSVGSTWPQETACPVLNDLSVNKSRRIRRKKHGLKNLDCQPFRLDLELGCRPDHVFDQACFGQSVGRRVKSDIDVRKFERRDPPQRQGRRLLPRVSVRGRGAIFAPPTV